jgi:hypothetical protein
MKTFGAFSPLSSTRYMICSFLLTNMNWQPCLFLAVLATKLEHHSSSRF